MPILAPPPLPVERFEEFKNFILPLDAAGWANAASTALSVQHMLGVAVVGPDAEEEALQLWVANFGTKRGGKNSERAQRAAEQPLPYAHSFAWGLRGQGWDQAAWGAVPPVKILELNSWTRWALSLFYAAHGQTPDSGHHPEKGSTAQNQQPVPSGRGNTAYNDDAMVARARKIYRTMKKPAKTGAAKDAIEKYKRKNPRAEQPAITEKAWIDRISRKI